MANMSYCRFENTLHDLHDCVGALEELLNDPSASPLSLSEAAAAKRMAKLAKRYLEAHAEYLDDQEDQAGRFEDAYDDEVAR